MECVTLEVRSCGGSDEIQGADWLLFFVNMQWCIFTAVYILCVTNIHPMGRGRDA